MKTFLTAILAIVSVVYGYGQKTKTNTLIKNKNFVLLQAIKFDEFNIVIDTVYLLGGDDARYSQVAHPILLKSGTIIDIYNFATKLQAAFFEEKDTIMDYDGQRVYVGKGTIMVYGVGKNTDAYIILNKEHVNQIVDETGKRF